MHLKRFSAAFRKGVVLASVGAAFSLAASLALPRSTETAVANGDTRTIHFYHTHTGETIDATFRVDGHYDQAVLDKLNYFLRDWRNNDQIRMDPRLFDTVWEVYRMAGADQPIQIYSAYRSPETNAMLRRRSRAVAEHSQHMLGKAMDTTMPGMSMEKIREIGMRLQRGGVGYYQSANFVHLDVGGVRSWPRMSYDQLSRLFPDGKTVHIPANGQPMARYEEARAEIAARGGTDVPPAQESQGFFAWLFGGVGGSGAQDEEAGRAAVASRDAPRAQPVALAYADPEGDEGGVVAGARPQQAAPAQATQNQTSQSPASSEQMQAAGNQPIDATAAEADAAKSAPSETFLPIPPRRPADLVASADLPLPPVRPDEFKLRLASTGEPTVVPTPISRPASVPDAIGGLITSTRAGVPALRSAALPAIITQGTEPRRVPTAALGFASFETTGAVPIAAKAAVARSMSTKSLALRSASALRADRGIAKASPLEASAQLAGPSIFGLRRAARDKATSASL